MKNQKILLNNFLLRAIRNEIWSENLRQAIRDQHMSIGKIAADCNLIVQSENPIAAERKYSFRFMPKIQFREVNLLRKFLEDPKTFGEAFGSNTLENIVSKLKIWVKHPEHGDLVGHPDTEKVFPGHRPSMGGEQAIIRIAIQRGFVTFHKVEGLLLTDAGAKLPKVQEALKHKNAQMADRIENYRE